MADLPSAVSYLKMQTPDPWVTQALVAAGETNLPDEHLKMVSGNLSTDYAKTILALASLGKNPATYGNIDYVAKLKTYYNNDQFGDINLLNDDAWSILALASVGQKNLSEIENAKNYLINHQNIDGGWGYALNGESDTNDTAAIIIALIEAGVSKSDEKITKAVSYLHTMQNDDGGFGWNIGSMSDSGSDGWVVIALNKLGESAGSWQKNGNTPISHLDSLQDSDGGYWWVEPGESEFNNKVMTAYAVIALANKTFPVAYFSADAIPDGSFNLRIEGKNNNICEGNFSGESALEIVQNAADKCNYTYEIENTAFGPYLKKIGDDLSEGTLGWLYFVNNISPAVGAGDYQLKKGDKILWFYGEWGEKPTRLTADKNSANSDETVNIKAEYFDGNDWLPLVGADIRGINQSMKTNDSGNAAMDFADGYFSVYAEKDGYVRSNKVNISVGSGVNQNVNMSVEISQGVKIEGESIIFSVSPSQLAFGKMKPGEIKENDIALSNQGTVSLALTSIISGDEVFTDNIIIGGGAWSDYKKDLLSGQNISEKVKLSIPANYLGSGVKTGEVIFWARAK